MPNSKLIVKHLTEQIIDYWDDRAQGFAQTREAELSGPICTRWLGEIVSLLDNGRTMNILDAGTGTGFFAVLTAAHGHRVTGIDLSPKMIEQAHRTARHHKVKANFAVMDAQNPDFAPESFDLIITRNLTWTLPDVRQAYANWFELLKSGGKLVNFDADYGAVSFAELTESLQAKGVANAHRNLSNANLTACDRIKDELPISAQRRPHWDQITLENIGYVDIKIDTKLSDRIYLEKNETFNPVRMFRIDATKGTKVNESR